MYIVVLSYKLQTNVEVMTRPIQGKPHRTMPTGDGETETEAK